MSTISSIDARFAQDKIKSSSQMVTASVANLVSGSKADANVADLSVGTVLATRVGTLRVAVGNAGQAKSLLETAKGAANTILDLLQKQKNLAVKAADDSLSNNERGFLNQEFQAIVSEVDRIAQNANFNGKALLDGSLSGKASVNSTTDEATENYTLVATGNYALSNGGVIATGTLSTTDSTAFSVISTNNIGNVRAETFIYITADTGAGTNSVLRINDGTNLDLTFSWADAGTAAQNTEAAAAALVAAAAGNTNTRLRNYVFENMGAGVIKVKASDIGTTTTDGNALAINSTSFTLTTNAAAGLTAAGAGNNSNTIFNNAGPFTFTQLAALSTPGATVGANRTVSSTDQLFDANLEGAFSNFTATFLAGGSSVGAERNAVTFTVDVNGKTYTSQEVFLQGTGGYNSNGNLLKTGQNIIFYDVNGDRDTNGQLINSGFKLVVGSSDVTISGTTALTVQSALNTIASGLEAQLSAKTIMQDRNPNLEVVSSSDDKIASALGTVFSGIQGYDATNNAQGDIKLRTDNFTSTGDYGSIGAFHFNRETGVLTTTVDGVTYSANLTSDLDAADTRTTTGQGGLMEGTAGGADIVAYNTSTHVLTLESTSDNVIVLATADTTDGREIRIDLNNVTTATVELDSDDAAKTFEDALNTLFGVSTSESLVFQVGAAADDTIGVSINSVQTKDIYKDDDGDRQVLSIGTLDDAIIASDVLDNAIRNAISVISNISASITSFNSSIQNNQASIQNADAARSNLLDTDYTTESTRFAESRVRVDAASAVLSQINSRIQNLLQLLQR